MHYHVDRIQNLTKQVRNMQTGVLEMLEFLRGPVPQDPRTGRDGIQPTPQGVINMLGDSIGWLDSELAALNEGLANLRGALDMAPSAKGSALDYPTPGEVASSRRY